MPPAGFSREDALDYHTRGRPGKIAIALTKPCATQRDLTLAYSPGVAEPVREIHRAPLEAYTYTNKGNLVAVLSNGTAILGLGDLGALASKPVMEGKALLFKRFADVDAFDIEVDATTTDEIVAVARAIAPTFGGINLEDIKAPECFEVEARLQRELDIPVFHDDQHGTAIISGAGLLNALELVGKRIDEVRVVISGAGASAIASAEFYVRLGVSRGNIVLCDTKGVIFAGRTENMNPYKARFAADTPARTLAEAMAGADVFLGLSGPNLVTREMVASMARDPIIFAMANPDPEIPYEEAKAARPDAIVATGRSDYPNQVNNVLGFPFIFRGALDVRARAINEEMKVAAARALAALAKEEVPESVLRAYGLSALRFGRDYIIPKPNDPRVPLWVAPAVAEAAMRTGVARTPVDLARYRERLAARLVPGYEVMGAIVRQAQASPRRIVFPEGEDPTIIRAAVVVAKEGIGRPVLLGRADVVRQRLEEIRVTVPLEVIDPEQAPQRDAYAETLFHLRQRKGVTRREAAAQVARPTTFGVMMVHLGDADACVAGVTQHYPDVIRPALQIAGVAPGFRKVAGLYLILHAGRAFVFADPTVNIEPTAEDLAEIAIMAAARAEEFQLSPRIAMISFSNFGSTRHPLQEKVRRATELVRDRRPDLMVDGEMMVETALVEAIREADYPFSALRGEANVLVFPSLEAANVAYKLAQYLAGATAIGPILMGLGRAIHVLPRGADVDAVVNMAALAVVDAQRLEWRPRQAAAGS
ncbi:MAG: NADP-dependent malic enzyme [Armatimonadota bacterium]|nr:NADP-dependent malic enzyme [Armatimonadota bacterium]MDR7452964.1 NADP-dependent malic enzyme [Armatimonadota bacterium]MDR7456364.1 NADP-dependent malic enzyme [Armatimonadota bacterium]MDR7496713.1 NADP-dependent malic enzyme [Armatimonadota bacterium]MDR7511192.1 NADP-dependent malic enzyme [Armatimonadota bacterium]